MKIHSYTVKEHILTSIESLRFSGILIVLSSSPRTTEYRPMTACALTFRTSEEGCHSIQKCGGGSWTQQIFSGDSSEVHGSTAVKAAFLLYF